MTGTPARFNPLAAGFRSDPYPTYHAMRAVDPVQRTLGMWVLTSYGDVRTMLRDNRFSSSLIPDEVAARIVRLPESEREAAGRLVDLGRTSLVFTDDPEHARLRSLVNRVFTRHRIESLRPLVTDVVDRLLESVHTGTGTTRFDIVKQVAGPLPVNVLCEWMALPSDVAALTSAWAHEVRYLLEPSRLSASGYARVGRVVGEFTAALADLVTMRRQCPGDDLISELATADVGVGDRLSVDELAHLCIMCFVAGTETTTALLGNTVVALLTHPEQTTLVAGEPARAVDAVDETLRYDPPLQMTKRVARADARYGGQSIRRGDQVLLCLGAANRDPDVFVDPDDFRIDRAADPRTATTHLGFGHGMHGCLGASLARLMTAVAVERLWGTMTLSLCDTEVTWLTESYILRGPAVLPVRGSRR